MVMTKRKEFDQVNDDFSDFSLSSPATKIRRLDAELAPIMEEEESESHAPNFHFPVFPSNYSASTSTSVVEPPQSVDELLENQERAIVLFNNPTTTIDINHPPPPQFSLTSHILSGLKNGNHHLWSKPSLKQQSSSQEHHVNNNYSSNQCLAVVPWVDSRLPQNALVIQQVTEDSYDDDDHHPHIMMEEEEEADENEVASMDIEEEEEQVEDNGGYVGNEQIPFAGFHQWQPQQQQQHCMVVSSSQLQNSTPTTTITTTTSPPPPPFVWFQT